MALPTFEVLCQQARQAIAERDWEKARQAYLQALGLKSDSADIHQGLATVCFQLRDLPSAAHHFKEVTRLDPQRAGAFINLGAVCNLLDRLDDAIAALRKGIQLDPQRGEGYYNLGLVYRRKNQVDLAVHAYREAIRVSPRMADAHYNLGNLHLEKEQYRQALDCYSQALQVRPDWEKAKQGVLQAREGIAVEQAEERTRPIEEAPAPPPPVASRKLDPNKMVDPEHHGTLLSSLHKATIEAENHGRTFHELAVNHLEPAVKELSAALITPDATLTSLDSCLQKFEEVIRSIRSTRDNLSTSIAKVRLLGEELVKNAS
jgi:tetratricopeptide (TPR) repeat protein